MAEKTRAKAEGNQPISRHPLFPAIVALWFGALFGLVSLAIKPELIERIVVASGIDSIVPMAAPPLGATMRILLALAMTGIGAVTGALIALRIARPQPEAGENSRPRRPRARKSKRGLALAAPREHENSAFAPFSDVPAHQPAREPAILNVSEFELDGYRDHNGPSAAEPVTGTSYQDAEGAPPSNHLFDTYSREIIADAAEGRTPEEEQEFLADIPLPPASDRNSAAERIASADLDTLSQMELLERLALAMAQRQRAVVPSAAAARLRDLDEPQIARSEPAYRDDPEPEIEPASEAVTNFPDASGWHEADEYHREIADAPISWHEEPEAGPLAPETEPKPRRVPAALRPVGHDSPDNDDALPGYIPPRHIAMPPEDGNAAFAQPLPSAFDEDEEEVEEEDVLEEGYSSLLDLSRSSLARPRFTETDEWETQAENAFLPDLQGERDAFDEHPQQVAEAAPLRGGRPFDGPAQSDAEATERALRAALATLQRMSGAA